MLATVDRQVQSQQAAQLAAQVASAKANADLAQNNYERAVALQGRGFVSKAEIDAKRAARDAANATVRMGSLLIAPLGAAIALHVTGNPLSLPVFIGILMLFGIVAKNSILLVDFAVEMMNHGMS